jgi:hypothetical protein
MALDGPRLALARGSMPSPRHEVLVELFRHRPELITALLALVDPTLAPDMPGAGIVPAPAEIAGVHHAQYRADLVLHRVAPGKARPAHAFVLEVQLAPDTDKDFTWPMHAAGIRARDRCPVTLVVLALDERTARWAAAPRSLSTGGPAVVAPVVIGPAQIPRVIDLAQAHALPELSVLSAAAHGHTPGAEHIAHAALLACAALDSLHHALYADFVVACLGSQARRALEVLMPLQHFVPQSDIGKQIYAEGLKEGRNEGLKEGRKEGRNEALRGLLVKQLTRRFGPLPEAAMSRIQAAGPDLLEHWGERLLSASSLDDVFTSVF